MPLNTCFQLHGFSNVCWLIFWMENLEENVLIQFNKPNFPILQPCWNANPPSTNIHTPANLEASGNGGILVVCSLRVSYQVVPAGEHLPAEGEVSLLCSVPSFICITSHPKKRGPERANLKNNKTSLSASVTLYLWVLPYVLMTTIRLYPKMPMPTSKYDRGSLNFSTPIVGSLL